MTEMSQQKYDRNVSAKIKQLATLITLSQKRASRLTTMSLVNPRSGSLQSAFEASASVSQTQRHVSSIR